MVEYLSGLKLSYKNYFSQTNIYNLFTVFRPIENIHNMYGHKADLYIPSNSIVITVTYVRQS